MTNIKSLELKYFPSDIKICEWNDVKPLLEQMEKSDLGSKEKLVEFIEKYSEISKIIYEEFAWKHIKMTRNTVDKSLSEEVNRYYKEVNLQTEQYFFRFKKKIIESCYLKDLPTIEFAHMIRKLKNDIELYKEENIPLFDEENKLQNKYSLIFGKMSIDVDGKEYSLSGASKFMKDPDRNKREKVWKLIYGRMLQDSEELENLLDELIEIRTRIAVNAGFDNYRDYAHRSKARFDYSPEDLFEFHNSVEKLIVPLVKNLSENKRKKLKVKNLKPWDVSVDVDGRDLKAYEKVDDFIEKTAKVLSELSSEYADKFKYMNEFGFLDLKSRPGKSPGGYNAPLPRSGAAFIFMNAAGHNGDVTVLLHECGHAMHSFATVDQKIMEYWEKPSEISELASMSMELLTLQYINEFYPDASDLRKATFAQLKRTLVVMPQAMVVDAFQQWMYTNPGHSHDERNAFFKQLATKFGDSTDWKGFDEIQALRWIKILHIFQAPFYFIEYAIAELGAIAIYKNYKEFPEKALKDYNKFLSLANSRSLPEIYESAGIEFDFSQKYISQLAEFMSKEIKLYTD